ncbi:MAG: cytochrome P450 [Acidimicrobiales bacterium]
MATTTNDQPELYYDPFDLEIDKDPHPVWKRMRDEAPLWWNDKHEFYALSRFADVKSALIDWDTFRSGKGSILEVIKAGVELPSGFILMEDPPSHDSHRGLMSRVFTPKRMEALEPKVREFCARSLDPVVGTGRFDFVADLGAQMPMRTIGMLLGIPEQDQEAIRDRLDEGLKLEEGDDPTARYREENEDAFTHELFMEYIDWRRENPSDDLMTELLNAEFEDETGTRRRLTQEEVVTYVGLLAGAGNETTTRLISWMGKLLAEHPDQRREIVEDRRLIPNAVEEILRFEAPSPVQARWVTRDVEYYGQVVPKDSTMVLLNGSANRDEREFPDADRFDIHRKAGAHLSFGNGIHFCLGAALARLEARVALDEVLNRFPEWEVDWDGAVQAHTANVRGWAKLPVITG